MTDRETKWRLILGGVEPEDPDDQHGTESLNERHAKMDKALEALYDSDRAGGLGSSAPNVSRWLGDVRRYFPQPVVEVIQQDAISRLNLPSLLEEPELFKTFTPDVHLAAALLSLKSQLPDHTRETARQIIRKVATDLQRRLREPLRAAVQSAANKARRRRQAQPKVLDWNKTILANLMHYQPEFRTVIPEKLYGYSSNLNGLHTIQILVDQSGSMASSVVYSGVLASVLASIKAVNTRFVVFDTEVADLTDELQSPEDLFFGLQLGGGTDICKALAYGATLIQEPGKTTVVLISDLFDWSDGAQVVARMSELKNRGVHVIVLLALNDEGSPSFNRKIAIQLARLDIPVFACTPELFSGVMAAAINKDDLKQWMAREGIQGVA